MFSTGVKSLRQHGDSVKQSLRQGCREFDSFVQNERMSDRFAAYLTISGNGFRFDKTRVTTTPQEPPLRQENNLSPQWRSLSVLFCGGCVRETCEALSQQTNKSSAAAKSVPYAFR